MLLFEIGTGFNNGSARPADRGIGGYGMCDFRPFVFEAPTTENTRVVKTGMAKKMELVFARKKQNVRFFDFSGAFMLCNLRFSRSFLGGHPAKNDPGKWRRICFFIVNHITTKISTRLFNNGHHPENST